MMYRAAFVLTIVGAVLLVVAIALPLVFPSLFDSKLNKKLILTPDSEMIESFKVTPIPIYFQVWIFNVTNPNAVLNGEKPILQQVGPYTYRQVRYRVDIRWNPENGTVAFQLKKFFYFEPSMSNGLESDLVTTINPVFITLVNKVGGMAEAVRSIVQLWFIRFKFTPFMTRLVGEMLFDGYDEPLLKELSKLTRDPVHELGKFGFFFPRNGTLDGETEIFTGELGMSNFQHISKWHGKDILDFWSKDSCNRLNGTDGAQFPRPIRTSYPIYLFTAELCRSIHAVYEKDIQHGPLTLNRFILPRSLLDNTLENRCFCPNNFTCRASMIDISTCRNGAPVVISTPHFYQGDKADQDLVIGLNPNKEEHETYLDIEPNTGVTMRVSKRIQVNMPLRKYGGIPALEKVPELIFPILWLNESVEVPLLRAEKLHSVLTVPKRAVVYASWALLAVGLFLILLAFILTLLTYQKNRELIKRRQQQTDKLSGTENQGNNKALLDKEIPHQYVPYK